MLLVLLSGLKQTLDPAVGPVPACRLPQVKLILLSLTLLVTPAKGSGALTPAPDPVPAAAGEVKATTSHDQSRRELLRRLGQEIRSGQLGAARQTARRYLILDPGNGAMAYNLACLETRLKDRAAAWQALVRAFATGFTDVRQAAGDPDLAAWQGEARFDSLLTACRERLQRQSRERGLILSDGYWSEEIALLPGDGSTGDETWPRATFRARFDGDGLEIHAQVTDSHFRDRIQPWRHGDGFLINLVAPPVADGYESQRFFAFGFGLEDGLPSGALLRRHAEPILQRVIELAPKIRLGADSNHVDYTIRIPWRSSAPYAPPLDSLLGLNVTYLSVDAAGRRRRLAQMPDPQVDADTSSWRRYALLALQPSERSRPTLQGRVSTTVVADEPLSAELLAWVPRREPAELQILIRDTSGGTVPDVGRPREPVLLQSGLNRWNHRLDLTELPTGLYSLEASVVLSSGLMTQWHQPLLRYDSGWPTTVAGRLAAIPALEHAAVRLRLDAVANALARHHPHDDPSPTGATMAELVRMLDRAEDTGSVLPAGGTFVAACSTSSGQPLALSLHLPPQKGEDQAILLVLLPDANRAETWLAERVGRTLAGQCDLQVLVPHLDPAGDDLDAAALAALSWGRDRFGPGTLLLGGLDTGGSVALRLSLEHPALVQEVLLVAGAGFDPWPGRTAKEFDLLPAGRTNALTYTLIVFPKAGTTGTPARHVARAMTDAGYKLELQELREGAYGPSQGAGLVCNWILNRPGRAD